MSTNKLPEDYVHSESTVKAAVSPPPGEERRSPGPETGGLPVSPAPTRSRTNLANPPRRGGVIGTPGTTYRRSAARREAFRSDSAPVRPRPARRRDDAAAMPANPPPARQDQVVAQQILPVTGTVRLKRNPWPVLAGVAGMIGMTLLCVMLWPAARGAGKNANPRTTEFSNPPASAALETRAAAELSTSQRRDELPADPGAALTMALDHLSSALDEAAEGSQEEILRKASAPGQDCRMAWTNDTPSLVFGRFPIRANSLAHTLEACAQAILRMR
jgi:hypothetical protein